VIGVSGSIQAVVDAVREPSLVPCAAGSPGAGGRQHQSRRAGAGDRACAPARSRPYLVPCGISMLRTASALAAPARWRRACVPCSAAGSGQPCKRRRQPAACGACAVLKPCRARRWWCCSGARASGTSRCARRSWSRHAPAPSVSLGVSARSARHAGCRSGQGAAGSRSAAARFCRRGARRPLAQRHRLPDCSAAASSHCARRGSVARTAWWPRPGRAQQRVSKCCSAA